VKAPRRTVLLLGATALGVAGLWLTREPMPRAAHRRAQRDPSPPAKVLAPVGATAAPTSPASKPATTPTISPSRPGVPPPQRAQRVALHFMRAFAALLYGEGDPEALPDASSAVRAQANSAPDLANSGRPPPHRVRGPWPDTGGLPAPGDVRLRAEVADPDQVLVVDLELQPDSRARLGWTVVGLGW